MTAYIYILLKQNISLRISIFICIFMHLYIFYFIINGMTQAHQRLKYLQSEIQFLKIEILWKCFALKLETKMNTAVQKI